ncbi:MAG: hypothetical protein HQL59_12575 [Magnetococcales bacterium]|nr:hypothetical protein [Magnetococcales bacterium]
MEYSTASREAPQGDLAMVRRRPLLDSGPARGGLAVEELVTLLPGAGGVETVLGLFASWMDRTIPLALMAYWNPRFREKVVVSRRGESEGRLRVLASGVMERPLPRLRHWRQGEWCLHVWKGVPMAQWDRLLIIESRGDPELEESRGSMEAILKRLSLALDAARIGGGGHG